MVEDGALYFIRTDHIGRPVFATDTIGTKVWEASYLPFGGVETSTGDISNLRFPGQWFQSEAGLHQNWMRDYDPTLGRYLQADPLGLVDGASVYGYALQNPGRYVDPRGERGILGGLIGGGSNALLQFGINYFYYRDIRTAARCIDLWKVWVGTVWGATGLSPNSLRKGGQTRNIPISLFLSGNFVKHHAPITIGDDCECQIPPERRVLPRTLDILSGLFL